MEYTESEWVTDKSGTNYSLRHRHDLGHPTQFILIVVKLSILIINRCMY